MGDLHNWEGLFLAHDVNCTAKIGTVKYLLPNYMYSSRNFLYLSD